MIPLILFHKLKGPLLILAIIGACWAYWAWSRAELAALHAELNNVETVATALKAEDLALRADITRVQEALDRANQLIADARTRSIANSQAIRNRPLANDARTDPRKVQQEINAATALTFHDLEQATRR